MQILSAVFTYLLLISFLAPTTFAEDAPMLSVSGPSAYLYAAQDDSSAIIAELDSQEKLTPLATVSGGTESWHMVKTKEGLSGWIKSSAVQGADEMEKAFNETLSEPVDLPLPFMQEPLPIPELEKAITIPIEVNGSMIVVPVVINRSLKIFMVMDTGASLTAISPRIAKQLGLRPVSRVSVTTANGSVNLPLTRLGSLKVGDAEAHGLMAIVQSISFDNRIEGVLGLNFLSRFHTSIDSERQLLSLAPR